MELISDEKKALRLARVIMDNLFIYDEALVKRGIEQDNILEVLSEKLQESKDEYANRVCPELVATDIFDISFVDVLIKRSSRFESIAWK